MWIVQPYLIQTDANIDKWAEAKLAKLFAIFGFCLQCHTTCINWLATIWAHVRACKAPMPCDNWLGLSNYKPDSYKFKTVWLDQQLNAMLHANKQALKSIKQSVQRNKDRTGSKSLDIPIRNHVLLCDHPEGWNKIQDRYKSDVYIVVGHHVEPNVYYIQLLNTDKPGPPPQKWLTGINCLT